MSTNKAQLRTVIEERKDRKLQADNTLITYARYRTPKTKSWITSLYPDTPSSLKSTLYIQKYDGKTSPRSLRLVNSLSFGAKLLLISLPYIFLLIGMINIFRIFLSDSSPEIYTILFTVYCGVIMILFMFNYHKLYYFVRVKESREYIERQGIGCTYSFQYFSLIFIFLSVVSLPILFVLILSDSPFVSETSIGIASELFFYISLSLIFFLGFSEGLEGLRVWDNFSTCMYTSFRYEDINVKGSILGEEYNMTFSIKDIHFFALLKVQDPYLLSGTDALLPKTEKFEGVTQLYIINKRGFANLCTYYIQGGDAAQDLLSFLTKQYPNINIRLIGFDNELETKEVLSQYRSSRKTKASFGSYYGIRNLFFFPRLINLKENRSSSSLPGSSSEDVSNVAITDTANKTNNDDIPAPFIFKKVSDRNKLYFLNDTISVSICLLLTLITIFFCPLVVSFFSFLMACFTAFFPQRKKWYYPGINHIPAFLILLLLILCIAL